MHSQTTKINVEKLKLQLHRVRIACVAAIELGDCKAVARLTCEAARLRDFLRLAHVIGVEPA
jgi:hypothetical protein